MAIAQNELFAPVMTVMKYDTLEEGVEIANGTRYGLGASVFGKDKKQCRWIMDRLDCGMVCSNGTLPFAKGVLSSTDKLNLSDPADFGGTLIISAKSSPFRLADLDGSRSPSQCSISINPFLSAAPKLLATLCASQAQKACEGCATLKRSQRIAFTASYRPVSRLCSPTLSTAEGHRGDSSAGSYG